MVEELYQLYLLRKKLAKEIEHIGDGVIPCEPTDNLSPEASDMLTIRAVLRDFNKRLDKIEEKIGLDIKIIATEGQSSSLTKEE